MHIFRTLASTPLAAVLTLLTFIAMDQLALAHAKNAGVTVSSDLSLADFQGHPPIIFPAEMRSYCRCRGIDEPKIPDLRDRIQRSWKVEPLPI